ncbi:MAG: tetratricopeptide repeat protein [Planctomycetota bacterium]
MAEQFCAIRTTLGLSCRTRIQSRSHKCGKFFLLLLLSYCNFIAVARAQPSSTLSSDSAERALYAEAAALIHAGEHQAAIQPLEQLLQKVKSNPASPLAATAHYFLAQSYLVSKNPVAAYEVLSRRGNDWPNKMLPSVKESKRVCAMAAGQAALRESDDIGAIRWYVLAKREADGSGSKDMEQEVQRIASAAIIADLGKAPTERSFCSDLQKNALFTANQITELKLGCGELLIQQGKHRTALELYASMDSNSSLGSKPDKWQSLILLRMAELQLATRDLKTARETLARAGNLTDSAQELGAAGISQHAFGFLNVRCHIADIEFEEALKTLTFIAKAADASAAERAKAYWMQGEVHFLQRKYEQAILAYDAVDSLDQGKWRRAAWLQKAKCYELTGRSTDAYSLYGQIAATYSNTPESENATARMAAIGTGSHLPTTVTR